MFRSKRHIIIGGPRFSVHMVSPYGIGTESHMTHTDAQCILRRLRLTNVFVPQTHPGARARVVSPLHEHFCTTPIEHFPRSQAADAEAAFLTEPYHAAAARFGGCILGVAVAGRHMAFWHAGRDSLTDFARAYDNWCKEKEPPEGIPDPGVPREYESVIHALAAAFSERGVSSKEIRLYAYGCIPPDAFVHSPLDDKYGPRNNLLLWHLQQKKWHQAIIDSCKLDLGMLVQAQATELGMRVEELEYLPSGGLFPFTGHTNPAKRSHRYLGVLVREA